MNWKCLLVGLALVFPGTLLSVEGRSYGDKRTAESEEDFLDSLFSLLQQQQQHERGREGGRLPLPPEPRKKLDTGMGRAETIQRFEEAPSGKVDNSAPVKAEPEPATPTGGGGSINLAAKDAPQASPLRQPQGGNLGREGAPGATVGFILVVTGCTVLAAVGIIGAGVCWYKYHRSAKAASVVDYPAYGVTGPTKDRVPSPGDRKLAHSAQMYHYQHQKQQMMALQSASSGEMKHDGSDDESVEDNDDADYTVYECPGLAPTGEMEVKNPLFRGDDTPSTPANDDTRQTPPEY